MVIASLILHLSHHNYKKNVLLSSKCYIPTLGNTILSNEQCEHDAVLTKVIVICNSLVFIPVSFISILDPFVNLSMSRMKLASKSISNTQIKWLTKI